MSPRIYSINKGFPADLNFASRFQMQGKLNHLAVYQPFIATTQMLSAKETHTFDDLPYQTTFQI